MPYGQIKVDEITFTNAGVDQTISVSGVVGSISGSITATGTISGDVIRGGTLVSGATVTGTAGQFGTITGNTAAFTTVTGTTVTGTTANFVTVSGTTVTGATAQFTTLTGGTAGFTTITGTTITGTTLTVASGTFSGNSTAAAFIPTGSTVPTNGVYLPAANTVGVATGGSGRLFVNSSGNIGINTTPSSIGTNVTTLEIKGASTTRSGGLRISSSDSSVKGAFYIYDGAGVLGTETATPLDLYTNNAPRLRITSAGLVGIGTSSPVFLTDILSGTANTGANVNNPSQLSVTGPNKSLTGGGATVFVNSNSDLAIDTGGSIALSGRNTTSSTSSMVWGVVKGAKENATSANTAGYLAFASQNHNAGALVEAMRIDSSQRVGIGTTSPTDTNGFGNCIDIRSSTGAAIYLRDSDDTTNDTFVIGRDNSDSYLISNSGNLLFSNNGSERARIDSSGRLLVGTSTATNNLRLDAKLAVVSTGSGNLGGVNLTNYGGTAGGAASFIDFNRSRGTTDGSLTSVASGDTLGYLVWRGATGSGFNHFAQITAEVDGTPGNNDAPGRLVFSTTADGASSPTERMRINNAGAVFFPSVSTTASAANAFLNSGSSPANQLLRSTSSLRYKTDIEDLEEERSASILDFRPVWYRSTAEADRSDWSWYGLIAEEVAEIEPRLVHWTYLDDAYEEVDGEKQLKPDAEMVPDGVQYDRLTVLLLDVVKRQQQAIETLEAKVTALESQ